MKRIQLLLLLVLMLALVACNMPQNTPTPPPAAPPEKGFWESPPIQWSPPEGCDYHWKLGDPNTPGQCLTEDWLAANPECEEVIRTRMRLLSAIQSGHGDVQTARNEERAVWAEVGDEVAQNCLEEADHFLFGEEVDQ